MFKTASALALGLALSTSSPLASSQTPIPLGVWGGIGMQLTITENGGTIDYGCDRGRLDDRPRADASGRFTAAGDHVFGEGGPREPGASPPRLRRALFHGTVSGRTMRIHVTLPDLKRTIGDFSLELGGRARLERCG